MSTFATGQTELDTDLPRTRPDDFYIEGKLDFFETDIVPETSRAVFVAPDRWHHLLVSIDIKSCGATWSPGAGPILAQRTFTSWSDFSWAYDDKDYRGEFLSPSGGTAPDGNGVLPPTGIVTQGATNFDFGIEGATHWDAVPVSAHGNPVGIPTSAAFVDGVYPVEMSELQFFTGVTLDTSIVDNRRPFITAAGLPADPLKKPNPPPPDPLPPGWVPPLKGPRELLGKDADILLHGSGNWISGKNTGTSTTINEIGKPVPVPGEDFAPTGKIVACSPDPSLHGPQSPPPPKPPAVLSMR
jgi:hypothetical protein